MTARKRAPESCQGTRRRKQETLQTCPVKPRQHCKLSSLQASSSTKFTYVRPHGEAQRPMGDKTFLRPAGSATLSPVLVERAETSNSRPRAGSASNHNRSTSERASFLPGPPARTARCSVLLRATYGNVDLRAKALPPCSALLLSPGSRRLFKMLAHRRPPKPLGERNPPPLYVSARDWGLFGNSRSHKCHSKVAAKLASFLARSNKEGTVHLSIKNIANRHQNDSDQ